MHLPDLEQAYFLQSLGLSIDHSFWQAGILWLFYQFIIRIDKKLPASIKYYISIVFVFFSITWFAVTLFQSYLLLLNNETSFKLYYITSRIFDFQFINNTLPYLAIAYLLMFFYYTLFFYRDLRYSRRLLNDGLKKTPVDLRIFTEKVAFHLGIKKKIEVWISENVYVPSVIGFIKPIILLPAAIANQLSIQQIEAILLHELAHIKRNDYLINILQSVVELVLFFNPFVISLGKIAKKERENCCDDCVIDFQYDRFEYVKALISLEEQRQLMTENFAMAATNGKKNLLQRVKRLFEINLSYKLNTLQKIKLATSGATLFLIISISLLISNSQNPKEQLKNLSKEIPIAPAFVRNVPPGNIYNTLLKNLTVTPVLKKKATEVTKKRTTKPPPHDPENEFVDAFINEDLLAPKGTIDAIPSQVAGIELPDKSYIVKIEEQQSGKKQTIIYFFELKNSAGKTDLKPLIILNKISSKDKITPQKTPKDSVQAPSNDGFKRKRITS